MIAAKLGKVRICSKLLAAGARVNANDINDKTALFHVVSAPFRSPIFVIDLLITRADLNLRHEDGDTILHVAIKEWNNVHTLEYCVQHLLTFENVRKIVNIRDSNGCSPLVTLLTDLGMNSNIKYELTAKMFIAGAKLNEQDLLLVCNFFIYKYCRSEYIFEIFKLLVQYSSKEFTPIILDHCITTCCYNHSMLIITCTPLKPVVTAKIPKLMKLLARVL